MNNNKCSVVSLKFNFITVNLPADFSKSSISIVRKNGTAPSRQVWSMHLEVHTWHFILTTSFLDKLIDIGLCLFMSTLQYFIKLIIIIKELWISLQDEIEEILSECFSSIRVHSEELSGIRHFNCINISSLDHDCITALILIN